MYRYNRTSYICNIVFYIKVPFPARDYARGYLLLLPSSSSRAIHTYVCDCDLNGEYKRRIPLVRKLANIIFPFYISNIHAIYKSNVIHIIIYNLTSIIYKVNFYYHSGYQKLI